MLRRIVKNNAKGVTSSLLTSDGFYLTVGEGFASFPLFDPGELYFDATLTDGLNFEIVRVVAVHENNSSFTLRARGLEGTEAREWASGMKIELRLTAEMFVERRDVSVLNVRGDYILSQHDRGARIRFTDSLPSQLTVPFQQDVDLPIGAQVTVRQAGAGQVGIASPSPVPGEPVSWGVSYSQYALQILETHYSARLGLFIFGGGTSIYTSGDGKTWEERVSGLSGIVSGFAEDSTTLVAVTLAGEAFSSPDGVTWTARASTFGASEISALTYAFSKFIAVGGSGKIATSPDGVTWTARTSNSGGKWLISVASSSTLVIAVGEDGVIVTSPDGVTWTIRAATGFGNMWFTKAVARDGRYLAAGHGGRIAYSLSGVADWTAATIDIECNGVIGIKLNELEFVGCTENAFIRSTDGITWLVSYVPFTLSLRSLEKAGNYWFAATSDSVVYTSTDGATWTRREVREVGYRGGAAVSDGTLAVVIGSVWDGNTETSAVAIASTQQQVVINSPASMQLARQHAEAVLTKVGVNEWDLSGELAP